MDSITTYNLIVILSVLFVSLLFLLIPLNVLSTLTAPFSFKTFGIRKVKRWYSRTDTLANFFLWISVIFAFGFPFIPQGVQMARIIFAVWMIFAWLCTISRAVRLSQVKRSDIKLTVIFMINIVFGYGLVGGLGLFDHGGLWVRSFMLIDDLKKPETWNLLYLLRSPNFTCYLLQVAIIAFSTCNLWGQFKYMRLENTYKGHFLATYIIKSVLVSLVLLGFGLYGLPFMEGIYRVEETERLTQKGVASPVDFDAVNRSVDQLTNQLSENTHEENSDESNKEETEPVESAENTEESTETENSGIQK